MKPLCQKIGIGIRTGLVVAITGGLGNHVVWGQCPPNPCTPATGITCCNEGISTFQLQGEAGILISNTGDATEGYLDSSCATNIRDTLYQGGEYPIYVRTNNPYSAQLVKAWIDFNANGFFESWERVMYVVNSYEHHYDTFRVPVNASAGSVVRVRVMAQALNPNINWNQFPTPCDTIDYGQYEDYSVYIDTPRVPPIADFEPDPKRTCDGTIQFWDRSLYKPTQWLWDFGDGTTSSLQNPVHTYQNNGFYLVKLKVWNSLGVDSVEKIVTVFQGAQAPPAVCHPQTAQTPCLDFGIFRVKLYSLDKSSGCGDEGYRDFTCDDSVHVMEGTYHEIYIWGHPVYPQDYRIYIDYNRDGIFTEDERALKADMVYPDPGTNGRARLRMYVQGGNVPLNVPLRMRIIADIAGNISSFDTSCYTPLRGQVEDYTIVLKENPYPPVADFIALPTESDCYPVKVQFFDSSLNAITSWLWDFGDGRTSTERNPIHYYTAPGEYTVRLMVCGPRGCDTAIRTLYIRVGELCPHIMSPYDTYWEYRCQGKIFDDGGPDSSYFRCGSGMTYIAPPGADTIWLQFDSFQMDAGDFLEIYCGQYDPNVPGSAVLLGSFSGNVLPNNGQPIMCARPVMTLRKNITICQSVPAVGFGFAARWWSDAQPQANFTVALDASDLNYCEDEYLFLSQAYCADWHLWIFEDGTTDTLEHPYHTFYQTTGPHEISDNPLGNDFYSEEILNDPYYSVTLIVGNEYGADTLTLQVPRLKVIADFAIQPPFPSMLYGGAVDFYSVSRYWVTRQEWDFGDPYTLNDTASGISVQYIYDTVGVYLVRLIACNPYCCDTVVKPVRVEQAPWAPQYTGLVGGNIQWTHGFQVMPVPVPAGMSVRVLWRTRPGEIQNIWLVDLSGKRIPLNFLWQGTHEIQVKIPATIQSGKYILLMEGEEERYGAWLMVY